jgi:ribosomal protein S18 acetylase RimI-like enzyme
VLIRDARPADLEVIVEFNCRLAEESENKTLDRATVTAGVAALLADPVKGRYFLAESGGCIAGQMMTTYEWSDWRNGAIWWLQSVYVHADFRRQGMVRQLLEHVLAQLAADPSAIGLRLYVDEHNHSAIETYQRFGFESGAYRVMERLPSSG